MSCRLRLHSSWPPALRGAWSHQPLTYFRTPSPGPGRRPAALHCQRAVGCWLSPPGPCDDAAPATRTQVLLAPIPPREPCFSAQPSVDPASSRAAASAHHSLLLLLFSSGIYYVSEFVSVLGGGSCHFVEGLWGRVKGLGGP